MVNAQDNMLTAAFATLIDEGNAPTLDAPAMSSRRTRIVEPVSGPVTGWRVSVEGFPHLDIETSSRGMAVVLAHAVARCTPGFANYGGHLFLWNYTVTDADGIVTRGIDMREEVQAARMAGK